MDKFRLTECQTLDIPAGNDVPLLVKLVKGFDGCDGEGVVPFPIDVCENVVVTMVSERGQVKSVAHRLGTDGEVLLELQAGDFRAGLTYGIDVRATLNGKAVHAYGKSLVRITAATERGPRQVAQAADPYEVTLYVGYVTDVVPKRTSELLNDGADGEHPFATEEQLKRYAPLNSPKFTGYPEYNDFSSPTNSFSFFLASKNWVYRFVNWYKEKVNGIASLDGSGKVPTAQIPDLPYIPSNKKGAANGVAELNGDGKVPTAQAQFAMRGNLVAADIDSTALQSGFYRIIGQRLGADILGGDEANGVLIQYSDGYKEQVLMVGRTAGAAAGEQVEIYTRRYLPTPKRWTAWSKATGGGGGTSDDIYVVHIRPNGSTFTLVEPVQEVFAARDAGKTIIGIVEGVRMGGVLNYLRGNDGGLVISLACANKVDASEMRYDVYYIFDGQDIIEKNSISYYLGEMTLDEAKAGNGTERKTISPSTLKYAILYHTSNKANTKDVYTKKEADERFQPKGNYLTEHQDISGKEDKMQVVAVYNTEDPSQPVTGVPCNLSTYYRIPVPIETFTLLLPTNPFDAYVHNIVVYLTGGTSPAVTIRSGDMNPAPIYYHDGYAIESGKTYELNILWNGAAWVVASVEIVVN